MGETGKRVISGLFLAAAFIFSFNYHGMYKVFLLGFVLVMALIAMKEFLFFAEKLRGEKISPGIPVFFTVYFILLGYFTSQYPYYIPGAALYHPVVKKIMGYLQLSFPVFGASIFIFFSAVLGQRILQNKIENSLFVVGISVLAIFYVPFTFLHLLLLQNLQNGVFYIWMVAWATAMSDTMAYFAGRSFGKHKTGYAVSPNKSWEGYIGGLMGQVAITVAFYAVAGKWFPVPKFSYFSIILFAVIIYFISVLGDLAESLFKRDSGVKDSGSLIPGHGGVLDTLDAMMLTIPAGYYFFSFYEYLKAS